MSQPESFSQTDGVKLCITGSRVLRRDEMAGEFITPSHHKKAAFCVVADAKQKALERFFIPCNSADDESAMFSVSRVELFF
jgi:hypothetical protein